jgi:hypothetical protein
VVTRLASLFGHAQEALTYLQAWDDSGTALHLVRVGHGESLQTSSPKGRVLHSMLEECLAWQHEQRVDLAWEKKAAPQVYGPARYGFARQGTHLVPKADEQATLAQMRRWQADRWSLRRIVTAPNQAGVPSKQRRRGHPSTVRGLLVAPYPHEGSEFELRGG